MSSIFTRRVVHKSMRFIVRAHLCIPTVLLSDLFCAQATHKYGTPDNTRALVVNNSAMHICAHTVQRDCVCGMPTCGHVSAFNPCERSLRKWNVVYATHMRLEAATPCGWAGSAAAARRHTLESCMCRLACGIRQRRRRQ